MPDYNPGLLFQGLNQGLAAFADAQDEQKTRAREFKALQEFADATGIMSKDQSITADLETLRGQVKAGVYKKDQAEAQRKAQMEMAQFAAQQKQQAADNDYRFTQAANAELDRIGQRMRNLDADRRADKRLSMDETAYADTVGRLGRAEAERGADRNAYRSMLQFAQPMQPGEEGPMPSMQFNAARAMQQTGGNIPPEDIAALEKMGRPGYYPSIVPLPGGGSALMTSPNSAMPWDRLPGAVADKALPPVVMTVPGATPGSSTRVPMTAEQYTAYQAANPPPAELKKRGDRAAFEEELRQHETALKAGNDDRYGPLNAFSRQNRVVELKRKLAELGAGPAPAASAPAAPAASEVKRTTSDGRTAVFDATTKKFLRYAD
jgi:hypothetical protein